MKYLLLIFTIIFTSCSNDKQIIYELKQNSDKYYQLSKTYYKNLNNAFIFIKYLPNKTSTKFLINIKPKDINSKLYLSSCEINKDKISIQEEKSKYSNWSSKYIIEINKKYKKLNLKCILNNKESFLLSI